MICEKCKSANATFHLTAIEGEKKKETHLCERCASEVGFGLNFKLSIDDILGNIAGKSAARSAKKCPICGMTLERFRRNGRLGCANDYEIFADEVSAILKHIQGTSVYAGKMQNNQVEVDPEVERARREAELARLKKELEEVVRVENYERAAYLRDCIRNLEGELNRK